MAAFSEQSCDEWLQKNYNVHVKREWLEACVEFLRQENGGRFNSQSHLNELVFEQLLMADFEEIMRNGSLPNVAGELLVKIQGKHALQINSVIDVGQSAYSQIQKMKGKDDPDSLKENSSNKDNWEKKVKLSRMLFLQMTDGSHAVQAMEYQQIPCLKLNTQPGIKVLIQGPVDCRLGVLLLTSKNITILGGCVDELTDKNSVWKMLHNAIGQEAPQQPTDVKIEEATIPQETQPPSNINIIIPQQTTTNNNCNQVNNRNQRPSNLAGTSQNQNNVMSNRNSFSSSKPPARNSLSRKNNSASKQSTLNKFRTETNVQDVDDVDMQDNFFEDVTDETFDFDQLDQMEQEVADTKPIDPLAVNSHNIANQLITSEVNDFGDENFDFDQLDQMEQEAASTIKEEVNSLNMEEFEDIDMNDNFDNIESDHLGNNNINADVIAPKQGFNDDNDLDDFDLDTSIHQPDIEPKMKPPCQSAVQSTIEAQNAEQCKEVKIADSFSSDKMQPKQPADKCSSKRWDTNMIYVHEDNDSPSTCSTQQEQNQFNRFNQQQQDLNMLHQQTQSRASQLGTAINKDVSAGLQTAQSTVTAATRQNVDNNKLVTNQVINIGIKRPSADTTATGSCLANPKKVKKVGSILSHLVPKVKRDCGGQGSRVGEKTLRSYQYLLSVLKDLPFTDERTIRIKGYISTLVSHSQVADLSQTWRVTVKINDGTASLDADLGEQVLSELLGCHVASFQREMVNAKQCRDPVKCRTLQQKTVLFQQKLSMISCLMVIKFSPSQARPLVVQLIEAADSDIESLLQKLK